MHAQEALDALVHEESAKVGIPAGRLQSVHYISLGIGTAHPVFSPSRNEDERKANRRVDFTFAVTAPQPPTPPSAFERCVKVLAGANPPGPARRMTCACNKFLRSPRALDSNYDFRARQQLPALATLNPRDLVVAVNSMVRHMRQDIKSSASGPSEPDFANNLRAIDDAVGRNINDFFSQQNAGAATSVFDLLVIADIQARMADPNHVYSCYAGYSRQNHDR